MTRLATYGAALLALPFVEPTGRVVVAQQVRLVGRRDRYVSVERIR